MSWILYYNIGSSKIKNTDLNHALKIVRMNEEEKKVNVSGAQKDKKGLIIIGGEEDVDYILADCCNPIPGDDIFAFATMNNRGCGTPDKLPERYKANG